MCDQCERKLILTSDTRIPFASLLQHRNLTWTSSRFANCYPAEHEMIPKLIQGPKLSVVLEVPNRTPFSYTCCSCILGECLCLACRWGFCCVSLHVLNLQVVGTRCSDTSDPGILVHQGASVHLTLRSHQTSRPVLAVKLLGIMLRNRGWPTTFHTITAGDANEWCMRWVVWSAPHPLATSRTGQLDPQFACYLSRTLKPPSHLGLACLESSFVKHDFHIIDVI